MRTRIEDVTVATYLDGRNSKNTQCHIVRIRVQYINGLYMVSTRERMTKKEYLAAEKDNIRFHENIKEKYFLIVEIVRRLVKKGIFSIARLKFELNHGDKDYFLTEVIDAKIRSLQVEGKPKTASMYEELKKLIGYLYEGKIKGVSDGNEDYERKVRLITINEDWIAGFKKKLRDKNYSNTTISIRMRTLRHILNIAEEECFIAENPMNRRNSAKIPQWNIRDISISDESLRKLLQVTPDIIGEVSWKWLQYWKFQYYGNGINIVDLLHLTWSDIKNDEIHFVRHKTIDKRPVEIIIPLIRPIIEILSVIGDGTEHICRFLDGCQYGTDDELRIRDNFTRNINDHVQRICKQIGIGEHLTTYVARHTYAMKMIRKNVPIGIVGKAMGHASTATMINYLGQSPREERMANARLLEI